MGTTSRPPKWIKPQLTRLVDEAPAGGGWLHEIKYDGYRMHARIDGGKIQLLTRLDWSHRYRRTIEALASLKATTAYVNGELCALNADGVPARERGPRVSGSVSGSGAMKAERLVTSLSGTARLPDRGGTLLQDGAQSLVIEHRSCIHD